jgi:hypothetical protein
MKKPPEGRAPRWAVLHNPPQLAGFVVGELPGTSEGFPLVTGRRLLSFVGKFLARGRGELADL